MGEPARRVLLSLAAGKPKLEKRAAAVIEKLGAVHAEVTRRGLDHDVGWLAALGPVGTERLARILPKEAPAKDVAAWWLLHGRRFRWDPTSDRFVAAAAPSPSLRLKDKARIRLEQTSNLVTPGGAFTLEMWWRSSDAATEVHLAGDEGWPELSTEKLAFPSKSGWVLRRIPDGKGAASLQFCSAVAPNDWWAISSVPLQATQQWEHVALVCSGDAVKIFRDGECVAARSCDGVRFLRSPTDLFVGGSEFVKDGPHWAPRIAHQDVRAVRLSEGARWKDDFTPPAAFEKDGATLVRLEFAEGASRLRDLSGQGHDGIVQGGRWGGPLDADDVRSVFKTIGALVGDLSMTEAESGAASTEWWVSERDGASDGFIHEIWSNREPDALGHWAKLPLVVEKAGTFRVWYVGGNLERHAGEKPYDHSPFSWRIDDAPAQRVTDSVPTVAGTRVERGLSVLGLADLTAGEHVFELRLLGRRGQDNAYSLWFDGVVLERVE
jgi:hypothetical protein